MSDFGRNMIDPLGWNPVPDPENIVEQLERFAALLPPSGTPVLARFKSGPEAYAALQNAADRPMTPQRPSWAPPYDITAVPIDLIGESWPPNLLVAIDQEGNAMKAWILND